MKRPFADRLADAQARRTALEESISLAIGKLPAADPPPDRRVARDLILAVADHVAVEKNAIDAGSISEDLFFRFDKIATAADHLADLLEENAVEASWLNRRLGVDSVTQAVRSIQKAAAQENIDRLRGLPEMPEEAVLIADRAAAVFHYMTGATPTAYNNPVTGARESAFTDFLADIYAALGVKLRGGAGYQAQEAVRRYKADN